MEKESKESETISNLFIHIEFYFVSKYCKLCNLSYIELNTMKNSQLNKEICFVAKF